MPPVVSIVMPAYNAGAYILKAIESVTSQTFTNWELIVVDDGSTDNTAEVVKSVLEKDKRVSYIYQPNQRIGAARNTAIKNSKGTWIAFLDSDDLWTYDKLEKQMLAASNYPGVDVIYTSGYIVTGDNLANGEIYPTKAGKFTGEEMYKMQYVTNYIPVLSVVVKRSIVDKIGKQEENRLFYGCEDWDYWLRMAAMGAEFMGLPEKLFYYRRHDNNMSSNILLMDLAHAMTFVKNFERNRFSYKETRKIFKPFIVPLVTRLVEKNMIKEASVFLKTIVEKIPLLSYIASYFIFRMIKKYSIIPIKMINKIDNKINNN